MTQPENMAVDVADGQAGHAAKHNAERTHSNSVSAFALTGKTRADEAHTLAGQKYTKPAAGIPVTDLVTSGLVQTNGTVLRAVKLTQAEYDAIVTKVATTLYVIV